MAVTAALAGKSPTASGSVGPSGTDALKSVSGDFRGRFSDSESVTVVWEATTVTVGLRQFWRSVAPARPPTVPLRASRAYSVYIE
jgi:hypothetical protein